MPQLPGIPPACPDSSDCPIRSWSLLSSVALYVLLACVALLALSLLSARLRGRAVRGMTLALLMVAGCAVVAALSAHWLLQHDPALPFGDIHYTPALVAASLRLYVELLAAATPAYILAACAFVVGVSVTASSLIRAALPPPPERMS